MQLVVARIGRAHGIKGEVTVEVRTDEPELRLGPGAVLATDPASAGPLTIETGRVHSGRLLLRFEGVRDRTGAEALRNTLLIAEVDPEELPEDPDEYYDHQLIDLDVVTADGTEVGRITEISHLPSQDLFIVERPDGSEVMIPFVEEIVTEIDLEEQRAVIDPPPGLIDDSEAEIASRDATSEDDDADAARRRHDLPRVPGTAERLARRQGTRARAARRPRARPARLDVRPAQHRRRHPVRRRPRHGHEDRALGRRAGRRPRRRLRGRARTAPSSSSPRPAAAPSPRNSPSSSPSGPG